MATVLLSAVEPSADQMGARLMEELRARLGRNTRFVGAGGLAMAARGFETAFDTSALSVMGVGDALRALPAAARHARTLGRVAAEAVPDVCVLIDAWGFSKLAATQLRRRVPGTPLVKLAAPQVWASRPRRAETAASLFDLILTLLPFEPPYFEAAGGRAVFVGNPNFEAVARTPRSGPAFRAVHGLGGAPLLIVLPGSRASEIARLMGIFGDAVADATARVPGLRAVLVAAPSVEDEVRRLARDWSGGPLVVPSAERFDAFDAGDAALAASGTVTTELAMCGTPMVVGYRTDALTAAWARRVLTTPYVSIVNVAAGEMVVPERLQEACTPEQLCADVVRLFSDDESRRRQLSAFRRVLPDLVGTGNAAARAADEIAGLVEREHARDLDAGAQG